MCASSDGYYLFVDILRMTTPGTPLKNDSFDFLVLGSFDALKITYLDSSSKPIRKLRDLCKAYQDSHQTVPTLFDKQPLYLYSHENVNPDVFTVNSKYDCPLIMTQFQLDDRLIGTLTVDQLIDEFKKCIEDYRTVLGSTVYPQLDYQVFYCMGESDIVVFFRYNTIVPIGNIIYLLDRLDKKITVSHQMGEIRVLSSCSHCAFPYCNSFDTRLKAWMEKETSSKKVQFRMLTNTSYGCNNKDENWILLGEWDSLQDDTTASLINSFQLSTREMLSDYCYNYRTSYTIPMVSILDSTRRCSTTGPLSNLIPNDIFSEINEYGNKSFSNLTKQITKCQNLFSVFGNEAMNIFEGLHYTLIGLQKHIYRLRYGRFEEDLFAFVNPVFEYIDKITNDCATQIDKYVSFFNNSTNPAIAQNHNSIFIESLTVLLQSYLQDTSSLISELQHLFSILSVSPHTYIETYGSNMRSIPAACKLLVAYHGIAYSLCASFNNELVVDQSNKQKENLLVLLFPYRHINNSTTSLYTKTSPLNCIFYISLNFNMMFDIPKTLLILLHECGHQIMPQSFRETRYQLYANTVFAFLLDNIYHGYYTDFQKIITFPEYFSFKKVSASNFNNALLNLININADDSSTNQSIEKIKKVIQESAKSLGKIPFDSKDGKDSLWTQYQNVYSKFEESISLKNGFAIHLRQFIDNCICNHMTQNIKNEISAMFSKIISAIKEFLNSDTVRANNPSWRIAALETIYSREQLPNIIADSTIKYIQQQCQNVTYTVMSIFNEIYSDLFSFYMLGMNNVNKTAKRSVFNEFLNTFSISAGFSFQDSLTYEEICYRLLGVWNGMECGNYNEFISVISAFITSEKKNTVLHIFDRIKNSITYDFIQSYIKECQTQILDLLNNSATVSIPEPYNLVDISIKLNSLYNNSVDGNTKEVVEGIHYFWRISTQREDTHK